MKRPWRSLCFVGMIILTLTWMSACGSSTIPVEGSGANLHIGNADALQKHGVKATATLHCPTTAACDVVARLASTLRQIAERLQERNTLNYYLATSQDAAGAYHLVVLLPGATDVATAQSVLITGALQFLDTGDTFVPPGTQLKPDAYPVVFTGNDLDADSVKVETGQAGQPVIDFAMKGGAKQRFADYTESHIGKYLTISFDWVILECATIQSQITGEGQISGSLTTSQARETVNLIKSGALPLEPTDVTVTVV